MLEVASGLMIRMGAALLLLSLLVRPAISSQASLLADTLAIIASAGVLALGLLGRRAARRREPPEIQRPSAPVAPGADWVQPRRHRTSTQDRTSTRDRHPDGAPDPARDRAAGRRPGSPSHPPSDPPSDGPG